MGFNSGFKGLIPFDLAKRCKATARHYAMPYPVITICSANCMSKEGKEHKNISYVAMQHRALDTKTYVRFIAAGDINFP